MSLAKAKTRLQNENVAHKGTNAFNEWKRGSDSKNIAIGSITEIKSLLHIRKRVYREKTTLSKANMFPRAK